MRDGVLLCCLFLFAGCGFHSHEWWAKGEGAEMELGRVLHPLNEFRDRMVFIRGLYNAEALKGNIHSSQTGNILSGAPLAAGGTIRSGTSIDSIRCASVTCSSILVKSGPSRFFLPEAWHLMQLSFCCTIRIADSFSRPA